MATNEPTASGKGRRGRGTSGGHDVGRPVTPTGKVLAAFRIPKLLHGTMQEEAREESLDLTAYVNRLFAGFLQYYGLPGIIRENLERDRKALGLGRYDYLQYVLYRRHEAVASHGEAFDRGPPKRK